MKRGLTVVLAIIVLAAFAGIANSQSDTRYFDATHHNVSGLFLQYWTNHGGLTQQGYPLTEEYQETSDLNGQTYTVQYFERAVFERHPENAGTQYEVLLSQLGNFLYKRKYPGGAPNQTVSTDNALTFPETGHSVGGKFRAYWEANGGLAQQGYPISDEFDEVSALNGQTYRVQYFERAVFELHPENQPPYDVLLSQLGKFEQDRRYPNKSNPAAADAQPLTIAPAQPTATTAPPSAPTDQPAVPTATSAPAGPQVTRTPTGTNCQDPDKLPAERKSTVAQTGPVGISDIHYQGQEYVTVKNSGSAAVDISGWMLRDKNDDGQQYIFPAGTQLTADGTVDIYTEPDHPYSFGSKQPIWNNCGDAAELLDASGAIVATYAYGTHLLP